MSINFILYTAVGLIHNLFWFFVLLAFLNKKWAYFNLYYLIPITYISHILPFHTLEKLKEIIEDGDKNKPAQTVKQDGSTSGEKNDKYEPNTLLTIYRNVKHTVDNYCFANPFSPQGMLIFGAVTSAYKLKR